LFESDDASGIAADVNNDGFVSLSESVDSDSDGLLDVFGNGTSPVDTDRDGYNDYLDIDSDRDGIVDIVESQSTSGYQDATGIDADSDGVQDVFDTPTENGFGI